MVQGYHVYKVIWTPLLGEMLNVEQEDKNDHNEYAVAITGRLDMVRHYLEKYQEFTIISWGVVVSLAD